jgi:hypothetical protein
MHQTPGTAKEGLHDDFAKHLLRDKVRLQRALKHTSI